MSFVGELEKAEQPHPPRPADEVKKCKTCGGSGKQVFASADHPSSMRHERPCPDCSPRPEDGKEGKCGECGKEKCVNYPMNSMDICEICNEKQCHGHPAAPEGKPKCQTCEECDDEELGVNVECAKDYDDDRFQTCSNWKTVYKKPAPDADAGGWREAFDKAFNDGHAHTFTVEQWKRFSRLVKDKMEQIEEAARNALIDEAVREVGKELEDGEWHDTSNELVWREAKEKAIAALNSLKQRP